MLKQTRTGLTPSRLALAIMAITGSLAQAETFSVAPMNNSCGYDINSVRNNYGGLYNSPIFPNYRAFAALKADGSISTWGDSDHGGSGAPTDSTVSRCA